MVALRGAAAQLRLPVETYASLLRFFALATTPCCRLRRLMRRQRLMLAFVSHYWVFNVVFAES